VYSVFLNNDRIGITELENADAPMGVVFGTLILDTISSGYDFFKSYCLDNNIAFTDDPEARLISTMEIPGLKLSDKDGKDVNGGFRSISGMDLDTFEIIIEAIPYPYYEEIFPHHVKAYKDQFPEE
jgi:hypothetical protein